MRKRFLYFGWACKIWLRTFISAPEFLKKEKKKKKIIAAKLVFITMKLLSYEGYSKHS